MASATFELWEKIFKAKAFDVTQDLHFITSKEIKAIIGKGPRLLAKMDSTSDVPPIFKQHGYFLLSVSRRKYAIVRGNGFHRLEAIEAEPEEFTSRIAFNLTTADRGTGESQYIDYCANAGLIEHIMGDGLLYPCIRGREGSGLFSFTVGAVPIEVTAAQVEIDLGLEGKNKIVVFEAKSKVPEDFIIRQLYYPYRRFRGVSPDKTIVPIFFAYNDINNTYNFWVYKFLDDTDYNSIQLVSKKSYKIVTANEVAIEDLEPADDVMYKNLIPQANSLEKVMDLLFRINQGMTNAAAIAEHFGFDARQSSYYREAAEALGLVDVENGQYRLTKTGQHLLSLGAEERNITFSKIVSEFSLVRAALDVLKANGTLSQPDLEGLIRERSKLADSTVERRAHSLAAWLKWIAAATGTFTIQDGVFTLVK